MNREFTLTLPIPLVEVLDSLHRFLHIIGQVGEEVDARASLQFVYADGVVLDACVLIAPMLCPEGDGMIRPVGIQAQAFIVLSHSFKRERRQLLCGV